MRNVSCRVCMLSLPLYFFSKKSLVNYRTVKWVAKKLLPFVRCFSSVNPKLNPVYTCSFLTPLRVRISSNDVITIRLLLKSLPISGDMCLLFTVSTTFGPKGHLT